MTSEFAHSLGTPHLVDSLLGPRPGERTNQVWPDQTNGFYYTVVDAMLKTGFTEDEIKKIGGENFLRVFGAATKVMLEGHTGLESLCFKRANPRLCGQKKGRHFHLILDEICTLVHNGLCG